MILSKFYFKFGNEWVYQGSTTYKSWSVKSLALQYAHAYSWRVNTYDTDTNLPTTGDDWTFTIENYPTVFNYERPDTYDPDLVWGWDTATSTYKWMSVSDAADITTAGGGRYGMRLICVGHNCVYYGAL